VTDQATGLAGVTRWTLDSDRTGGLFFLPFPLLQLILSKIKKEKKNLVFLVPTVAYCYVDEVSIIM
jgi:hypothetical protein